MNKLKTLNDLCRGIDKHWIWGGKQKYYQSQNYLRKIEYCIHDLNVELEKLDEPSMKEVIYIIVQIDWICKAVEEIYENLLVEIKKGYICRMNDEIMQAQKFFKAVRSFVVAHPLSTERHKEYGFDGDLICVDIRKRTSELTRSCTLNWFHLDIEGLKENVNNRDSDFVLYIHSKKEKQPQFFEYVGMNFFDLYRVAELQIEKLYDLDRYLAKLKKKDFEVSI